MTVEQANKIIIEKLGIIRAGAFSIRNKELERDEKISIAVIFVSETLQRKDNIHIDKINTIIYGASRFGVLNYIRKYIIKYSKYTEDKIREGIASDKMRQAYERVVKECSLEGRFFDNLYVKDTIYDKKINIEKDFIHSENIISIRKAIDTTLTTRERKIVIDMFYKNKIHREIGEELGLTKQGVNKIYHKDIVRKLRKELKGVFEF